VDAVQCGVQYGPGDVGVVGEGVGEACAARWDIGGGASEKWLATGAEYLTACMGTNVSPVIAFTEFALPPSFY